MPAYKIHVTNVPWHIDYNHAVRFASASARHDYFSIDWTSAPLVNLDFGTGFRTSAVVTTENTRAASQYNYAVIYDVTNDLYYYYFVVRAEYLAANKYRYHLVCDVIQQTLFDITFGDCMIRRAHLNRWEEFAPNQGYIYHFAHSSPFLDDDFPDYGTYVFTTEKLGFAFDPYDTDLNWWIRDNIAAWKYYFFPKTAFNAFDVTGLQTTTINIDNLRYVIDETAVEAEWVVFCAPIYKSTNRIYFRNSNSVWDSLVYDNYFKKINDGIDSKLYAVKISIIPPFSTLYQYSITKTNNNITFIGEWNVYNEISGTSPVFIPYINSVENPDYNTFRNYEFSAAIVGETPVTENEETVLYPVPFVFVMNQTLIRNGVPALFTEILPLSTFGISKFFSDRIKTESNKLSPILFGSKYFSVAVNTGTEKKYNFDVRFVIEKSTDTGFYFLSILAPYITTEYISIIPQEGSVLFPAVGELYKTFYGYLNQNDDIIALSVSQYEQFIANQKNFFKAFKAQMISQGVRAVTDSVIGGITGAAQALKGDFSSGVSNAIGGVGSLINSANSMITDVATTRYKIDNLKAAPETLQNAGGDELTNIAIVDRGINCEINMALPYDEAKVLNCIKKYGYPVNVLGNVSDYIGIRKLWNFIQADVETVNSTNDDNPIGVEMHDQIKTIFARGITFWTNPAGISDYSGQNYEVFLDG